jgi:transposase
MPKPYSDDLRERVIEAVAAGASRREAAESFNLCPSSAVKWLQRWHDTGSAKAKPTGGSTSPLEAHAERLLALVAEQPDLTLDEIVAAMRKRRIRGSRTAVWRFFARHDFTFKKALRGKQWVNGGAICRSKSSLSGLFDISGGLETCHVFGHDSTA